MNSVYKAFAFLVLMITGISGKSQTIDAPYEVVIWHNYATRGYAFS